MFEKLTGYSCDELVGKNYTDFFCSDSDKTIVNDAINAQIKKGKVCTNDLDN